MTTFQNRQPKGQPTGGEFAAQGRPDADVTLGATPAKPYPQDRTRLGASLAVGDPGPYALTKIKSMNGREGVAYSATLTENGHAIGEVHNDGNGGETMVRVFPDEYLPKGSEKLTGARQRLSDFVEKNWTHRWGADQNHPGFPHSGEDSFADTMFENVETLRTLRRARGRGVLPVLFPDDDPHPDGDVRGWRSVPGAATDAAAVARVWRNKGEDLTGMLFFDGDEWKPLADA